jgi:hypothetical protein
MKAYATKLTDLEKRQLKESEDRFLRQTLMRDNELVYQDVGTFHAVENTATVVTGDKPTPVEIDKLNRRLESLEGELRHLEKKFNEFFDSKAKPKGF